MCSADTAAVQRSLSVYCASPQNGQRSVRACSGLRQCQQKRGCGRLARLQPRLDVGDGLGVAGWPRRARRAGRAPAASRGRQHVVQQVRRRAGTASVRSGASARSTMSLIAFGILRVLAAAAA